MSDHQPPSAPAEEVPLPKTVCAVNASEQEEGELRKALPASDLLLVSPEELIRDELPCPISDVGLVVVCTSQTGPETGCAFCNSLRQRQDLAEALLLLVVNRYEIHYGNAVRRLPKSHFLVAPLAADEMLECLRQLAAGPEAGQQDAT